MLFEQYVLLWVTALVFTICSFIFRKHVLFPLLAFVFWSACALSMQDIDFIGFGSVNVINYSWNLGDHSGDIGLMYLLHLCGIMMFLYALYNGLLLAKRDIENLEDGKLQDWERISQ